jgi:uncharacterized protein
MLWVLFILLILVIILGFTWWLVYRVLFQPDKKIIWQPSINYKNVYISTNSSNHNDFGKCYTTEHRNIEHRNIDHCNKVHSNIEHRNKEYRNKDECINCWYFNNYPGKKIILFFHGNYGNISYCSHIIDLCQRYHYNLLLVDYRGYGKSDSIATIGNLLTDGKASYNFLIKEGYDPNNIIVWGESMGGAVATYVASTYKVSRLVLMSTFSSLDDIINESDRSSTSKMTFGFLLKYCVQPIPNKKWIKRVNCPIIIIHSKNDTYIPHRNAEILYKNIYHSNKIIINIDGDHSSPKITLGQLKLVLKEIGTPCKYLTLHNLQKSLDLIDEACLLYNNVK